MVVFAVQPYYERFTALMAASDPGATLGKFEIMRFPNKEIWVAVREGVAGKDCLLVGSIAPPDSQLAEFLMMGDALKRGGARTVSAFLPYLAYARQDKFGPGQSGGIAAIGALFRAAGIGKVITIDLHSELDKKLIGLPIVSLPPAPDLFVDEIQSLGWEDPTIVAPDQGAVRRSQEMADALGIAWPVAHLIKHRGSIVHVGVAGEVGPRAVVVDDILDSGHTLVSACNVLRQQGARQVAIAVTHGLFTGQIWRELFILGIEHLFVSNSCPQALKTEDPWVKIVSIGRLLPKVSAEARKEVQNERTAA
jgi:ribose-phosphate pyrophosphokinase